MEDNAIELMREIHAAASLYIAAKADGNFQKMKAAAERLTKLSSNYLDGGGNLDDLVYVLAGEEGAKKKNQK